MSALLDELLKAKVQLAGAAPENADVIANLLRSKLDVRPDGSVRVVDDKGNVRVGGAAGGFSDMTLDELVAETAAAKPAVFRKAEPVPASEKAPTDETMTARAAREARERQVPPPSTGPQPNPFMRATWNLTAQALVQHRDPEQAERLKREAAALPAHLDRRPYLDINHP